MYQTGILKWLGIYEVYGQREFLLLRFLKSLKTLYRYMFTATLAAIQLEICKSCFEFVS